MDEFLQMIFVNPGEIVRIAPLGRVAHNFHEQARTIHSTMRLWNNNDSWNESDVVRHLAANSIEALSKMKVVIGLEMFMMTDHVLSGFLQYLKQHHPHTLLLFEGDPIQLGMGKETLVPVLCRPEFDAMFDTIVFDKQQRITNMDQQAALDAMRLAKADSSTLSYWQSKCVPRTDTFDDAFTIYATNQKSYDHNEIMLRQFEQKKGLTRIILRATDTFRGQTVTNFSSDIERCFSVEKDLSLVIGAPVFINHNIYAKCDKTHKEIYVGNGTPATVISVEKNVIILQLELAIVKIEPYSFEADERPGYMRTQFPLILGWSSSFHKVQGMQFPKIRVDFCLDGSNPKQQSTRLFYQGMAYMGLSRSNCVTIQGNITLELLNNVNPSALEYWLQKLDNEKLRKPFFYVYRDAIHAQNDSCAQKAKEARKKLSAPATAAVSASS
jgi:hypothetical protein